MLSIESTITLNNDTKLPVIWLGVRQMPDGRPTIDVASKCWAAQPARQVLSRDFSALVAAMLAQIWSIRYKQSMKWIIIFALLIGYCVSLEAETNQAMTGVNAIKTIYTMSPEQLMSRSEALSPPEGNSALTQNIEPGMDQRKHRGLWLRADPEEALLLDALNEE
jgi:hypothetical protein